MVRLAIICIKIIKKREDIINALISYRIQFNEELG